MIDDATVAQEDHSISPRRKLRVVRHEHAGDAPLARRPNETHHALAVDGVERAGRLVGQQQPAITDDRAGDRDALTLAARQLVGIAVGAIGDTELFERRERGDASLPSRECRRARAGARRSRPRSGRAAG